MKFFSPDSKFMQAMSRLGDLIVLNCVFLLTCIPVFTVGPALTALYTAAFRIGTDREGSTLGCYFRAFRKNFRQSTLLWLLVLAVGVCLVTDVMLFARMTGPLRLLYIPASVMLLLLELAAGCLFPLLSQFNETGRQALKNALLLSIGYLPRSLMIALLNVFPFGVLLYSLLLFLKAGFLWVFLYFSAAAYFNALLLKKVFAPFRDGDGGEEPL